MTSRSARLNSILLPSTIDPDNIGRNTQGPESYDTARDPPAQKPAAAEMFTQPDLGLDQNKDETEESMEVSEKIPSRSELESLLVNERNQIGATTMKEAPL